MEVYLDPMVGYSPRCFTLTHGCITLIFKSLEYVDKVLLNHWR